MTPQDKLISLIPRFHAQGERLNLLLAQSQAAFGRLSVALASRPQRLMAAAMQGDDLEKQQIVADHTSDLVDAVDRLADLLDRHNRGVSIVLDEIETICREAREKMES